MSIGLGVAICGIAMGIGLYLVSRAINQTNSIKKIPLYGLSLLKGRNKK